MTASKPQIGKYPSNILADLNVVGFKTDNSVDTGKGTK